MGIIEFLLQLLEGIAIFNALRRRPFFGCLMTLVLLALVGAGLLLCGVLTNVFTPATPHP